MVCASLVCLAALQLIGQCSSKREVGGHVLLDQEFHDGLLEQHADAAVIDQYWSNAYNGLLDLSDLQPKSIKSKQMSTEVDATCLLKTQLIVFAACSLLGLVCLSRCAWMPWVDITPSSNDSACGLGVFYIFVSDLTFVMAIPQAFTLAEEVGMGATYSGALIAATKPGVFVGSLICWLLFQRNPDIWRTEARSLVLIGGLLEVFGALVFGIACLANVYKLQSFFLDASYSPALLVASRFVMGIGDGLILQLCRNLFGILTPVSERPAQMLQTFLGRTMGLAMGPIFAAGAETLASLLPCGQFLPGFISVATAILTFPVVVLLTLFMFPSLESATSFQPAQDTNSPVNPQVSEESADLLIVDKRKWVLALALLFSASRAYAVSALESATALILELEHHVKPISIGLMVSCCFLITPILKFIDDALSERISLIARLRVFMSLAVSGGAMMLISGHVWLLLTANALLWPSFFLSDALVQGVMLQHAFPSGHLFDVNNLSLALMIVTNAVSRTVGPPLARWHVEHGGQVEYAIEQFAVCVAGWALAEWLLVNIVPLEDMHHEEDKCNPQDIQ